MHEIIVHAPSHGTRSFHCLHPLRTRSEETAALRPVLLTTAAPVGDALSEAHAHTQRAPADTIVMLICARFCALDSIQTVCHVCAPSRRTHTFRSSRAESERAFCHHFHRRRLDVVARVACKLNGIRVEMSSSRKCMPHIHVPGEN